MQDEELTHRIIGCCYEVMNELGTGFLESVYHNALLVALQEKEIDCKGKVPLEVKFRGVIVGIFEADILVEDRVILELKVAKETAPEHLAQLINYLKATGLKTGLVINFGKQSVEVNRVYG